jgi:hypothetical protein
MLECLAERTIALAQLRRLNDPAAGYDSLLERRITGLLPLLKKNGVRLVTNMGAANPLAGAELIVAIAEEARPQGARCGPDRLTTYSPCSIRNQKVLETGEPLSSVGSLFSANAILAWSKCCPRSTPARTSS